MLSGAPLRSGTVSVTTRLSITMSLPVDASFRGYKFNQEQAVLMATDQGFERDGWKKLNQELGLTAIHIPEAYGGGGFGQALGDMGPLRIDLARSLKGGGRLGKLPLG